MEKLSVLESEWYILNDMLGDLKSRKIRVPLSVYDNLRYTRFIIMHYRDSPEGKSHTHRDYIVDLETALNNVKTTLFALAQDLGEDYVALWEKKVNEAPSSNPPQIKKTFVIGVSRDAGLDFVRIRFDKVIVESEFMELAKKYNVNIELEKEKVAVVSGAREDVKKVIREIARKYF